MPQAEFSENEEELTFSFWLEGDEQAEYRIAAFKVEEALFSLTKIEALLKVSASALDFTGRLGKKGTLSVKAAGLSKPACFSGMVAEASEFYEDGEALTRLVLLPSLARLAKEPHYRVFQELTVPDIVETLLCEHGISEALWQLEGSFVPRRFTMQYNETDLAFMQRILAEEGIFYYFIHEERGRQQPIFCNNIHLLLDCPNGSVLKHDSHGARGLYDVAGGAEVYCHSLCRSHGIKAQNLQQGRSGAAAGFAPSASLFAPYGSGANGSSLSGIAHLPLPVCGHKVTLSCPFDKSLNGSWSLIAVRHEGIGPESRLLSRNLAEYFGDAPQSALRGLPQAEDGVYGRAFGAESLLPRLLAANGGPVYDSAIYAADPVFGAAEESSPYGVPYNGRRPAGGGDNVVQLAGKNQGQDKKAAAPAARAAYACAFTALDAEAHYQPLLTARPVIAGPQEARLAQADKAGRRYRLALLVGEAGAPGAKAGGAAAGEVCFWAYADTQLGAAAAAIAAAAGFDGAEGAVPAGGEKGRGRAKCLMEFLGGNPDRPIILPQNLSGGFAGRAGGGAAFSAGDNAAAETAAAPLYGRDYAALPGGAKAGGQSKAAAPERQNAIPLAQLQADLYAGAALPGAGSGVYDGSRFIQVAEHQREDINGIYELNCGEKHICRAKALHFSAAERLILRGPGGKIIIDKYSISLEAPLIRLKGRLAVEEDAFDRRKGVEIAIRDELPLVTDCAEGPAPAAAAGGGKGKFIRKG